MNRVAIVGASGSIGSAVLKALIASGKDVTVFSRSSSAAVFPEGARVLRGDYEDQTFLQDGLIGIDALVLCVGTLIPATQIPIIDAAISAGVKWIIPSEFGTDSGNSEYAAEVPIIPPKVAVQEYLNEQVAKTQSQFMWTGVINGLILDWSLPRGVLGIDTSRKKAVLLDQGVTKVNMTTLPTIGRAVASLLQLPPKQRNMFVNKLVYISSFCISQIDLLGSVQRVTSFPQTSWDIQFQDTEAKVAAGKEKLKHGDVLGYADLIYGHVFKDGAGGNHQARVGLSNQILSLPNEDLDEEVKRILANE
ncbi:NAD(P)-binding protein [Penicillium canescens]|uniref:NAD(P)-binding protein n=1 Tax=Penicillium canescens TaxID=5083 RepID=A0AAD6I1G5_PENCN|nr:NAD(P)-binding protein [Penicillium canescens]KAJ6009397.1 NAD(P)-binding protein [Penicillium canescens]KAJ6027091.1 NAD(P)-binding protein [Penicillium canescens]KAJ6040375.1 NAD(P)-binding protein [Penicillium canescens]KAJ6067272.1 NAD(P)-binding protein [Penicillium canescens]KAJ6085565.1 NAD(P)-binding protein [Penicillium canescens]